MLIKVKRTNDIPYSEVTPKAVYMNRRKFLAGAAIGAAAIAARPAMDWLRPRTALAAGKGLGPLVKSPFSTSEAQTPYRDVTTFNNFWEFGTDKDEPAKNTIYWQTSPWSVSVEGEVAKPRAFTMDELLRLAPLEERIYRHRCVEGWSIVVPWVGYSLNVLAKVVQP